MTVQHSFQATSNGENNERGSCKDHWNNRLTSETNTYPVLTIVTSRRFDRTNSETFRSEGLSRSHHVLYSFLSFRTWNHTRLKNDFERVSWFFLSLSFVSDTREVSQCTRHQLVNGLIVITVLLLTKSAHSHSQTDNPLSCSIGTCTFLLANKHTHTHTLSFLLSASRLRPHKNMPSQSTSAINTLALRDSTSQKDQYWSVNRAFPRADP